MDAFWLHPDWSGGSNLRDPGAQPFWMLPPKRINPAFCVEHHHWIPRGGRCPLCDPADADGPDGLR